MIVWSSHRFATIAEAEEEVVVLTTVTELRFIEITMDEVDSGSSLN